MKRKNYATCGSKGDTNKKRPAASSASNVCEAAVLEAETASRNVRDFGIVLSMCCFLVEPRLTVHVLLKLRPLVLFVPGSQLLVFLYWPAMPNMVEFPKAT